MNKNNSLIICSATKLSNNCLCNMNKTCNKYFQPINLQLELIHM